MDADEIRREFEADFPDVRADAEALQFAIRAADDLIANGEKNDSLLTYQRAGHQARSMMARREEGKKTSAIVNEMRKSRGQSYEE